MQLRFATWGAAEGWAEVQVATSPFLVSSEEAVLHDMATHPGTLARYVVVEDGEVLGISRLRARGPGEVSAMVQVRPDHQNRGVGGLLLHRLLAVAGDREVSGLVNGDERSLAVARHWGFEPQRENVVSSVVPADALAPAEPAAGMRLCALADLDPAAVWACNQAAVLDDTSQLLRPLSLEEYVATRWNQPLHRPDLGRAVLEGDAVVAFCEVTAASGRAWNAMTGTRPSCRGRGLAQLVKAHALGAMAHAGITRCSTANAGDNAPMLAVNARLGYRPSATTWTARRPAPS